MASKTLRFDKESGKMISRTEYDREEFVGMVNVLYDRLEEKDELIRLLREALDRPNDERLADAHATIRELKEEYRKLWQNSLIVLSQEEMDAKDIFVSNHFKENRKCYKMSTKFLLEVRENMGGQQEITLFCSECGTTHLIRRGEARREPFPNVAR